MSERTIHEEPVAAAASRNGPYSLSDRVKSLRIAQRRPAQPVGRWWLPWALALLLLGSTVFFALRSPPAPAEPAADSAAAKLPSIESLQQALEAQRGSGSGPTAMLKPEAVVLDSKGYIVPVQLIQVSPKVAGMVTELNFQEGKRVEKGFVLAKLETVEYEAEYRRAVASAAAAMQRWEELKKATPLEEGQLLADLREARYQRDRWEREWKRNQSLRAENLLSDKEFEEIFTTYKAQEQKVQRLEFMLKMLAAPRQDKIAGAKAEWDQAQAEVAKAKWRLDNCTVTAPISGTILTKKAEEGNIVNPAAFNISASLCEMADLYNLEVDLAIAERDVSRLFVGQKCRVRAEAFPARIYPGVVSRIMPQADRSKGAVPVRVKIQIVPRPDDATPESAAQAVGVWAAPGVGVLAGLAFAGGPPEAQGQYLRPEMGALVSFLNSRAE